MASSGVATLSPIHNEPTLSPRNFLPQSCMDSSDSIWIYLSVSGSKIPMHVFESDSIESVKLRIQSYKGFVVKKQKLVCGGRELARSSSLLKDYGVIDGNVLHLVLKLSDLQLISVQTSCGKEFTFNVERGRDVAYVKERIAKKVKEFADLDEHEVECEGKPLEDQRLIDEISNQNAVIHLFVRKSAKVRARPVDKNFELSISAAPLSEVTKFDLPEKNNRKDERKQGNAVDKPFEIDNHIVPRKPPDLDTYLEPIIVNPKTELPSVIWNMIDSTFNGLDRGNIPIRSMEGTGGAYFMLDSLGKKYLSVFKPIDEEPMASNNPRGLPVSLDGEGLKKGTRVGEGAYREVAAYLLDHPASGPRYQSVFGNEEGFAGVPPTVLVRCFRRQFNHLGDSSVKIGSLQMFMENNGSTEDIGYGAFPIKEVHKISVLDIRLANADRHGGNILLGKKGEDGQIKLIPIDHGYCLPTSFEDCTFEWLYWPQAKQPYCSETLDYIKSLDAEEDIALLKFHGWDLPLECARIFRISTMLLKKGVERGFTPFKIGSIICRENLNEESVIEEIVKEAIDCALPHSSESAFLETVSEIMDRRLDQITSSSLFDHR